MKLSSCLRGAIGVTAAVLGVVPAAAQVPDLPTRVTANIKPPLPAPFGPGELLTYEVKVGFFTVGRGHMQVVGLESVRGARSYHLAMGIEGKALWYRIEDLFQSWIGVHDLVGRRFIKDQDEGGKKRYEHWEFFPEEKRYERVDNGDTGEIPTSEPLDDISFIYYARTLPLEVGDEYVLERYYTPRGNPVVLQVLRTDTVEVPAGTFETIVVRPIIQTRGLFGQGGEAEVHLTNDERRLMVYMRAKIPIVGSLTLHLRTINEGSPLRAPGGQDSDAMAHPSGIGQSEGEADTDPGGLHIP
jgi:hypothetical protein